VVYGAGSLWQWRYDAREEHQEWCIARDAGWLEALSFSGSRFVGVLSRIFEGLPFAGMQPDYRHTYGRAGLIVPGRLLIVYLPEGGDLALARSADVPPFYRVIDPCSGALLAAGEGHGPVAIPAGAPRVVIFTYPEGAQPPPPA
jgi:hypothetical protein